MQITINGQTREFGQNINLRNVIEQFCKKTSPVIAEVNGNIVRPASWQETTIKDGDTIELISFVGGG